MVKKLISICIPTFNGEAYIKQCLDSCINQTYKNYEIVICDDGSDDATPDILAAYAKEHSCIRFFKNQINLGLVGNWNRCIELSEGEWIKFLFQDDYMHKDCLQKFLEAATSETQLLVSARHFILPESATVNEMNYYTSVVRTLENTNQQRKGFFSPRLISKIAVQNMSMNFIGEPSLTFFKKELVDELGYFNSDLKQICDLEFFLRVASKHGLQYLPEKLCAFRIHSASTTSTNIENKYFELRYIEPLVFSWFLLYHSAYSALRSSLTWFYKMKLNLYFKVKCYMAFQANAKEKRQHPLFAPSSSGFKEIYAFRNGNMIVRMISALRK